MKKILVIIALVIFSINQVYALDSSGVIYDNSGSGSTATNVKDALNDLYSKLNQKQEELNSINNIGNAASNHILSGYTAYVKGKTVTGTIASKGATTYTPGTKDQTIASGNYLSGTQTIKGDANLIAANIAKGKSIFGVNGTYTSDANAIAGNILSGKTAYVNGSKITGSMANQTGSTGLTLTSTDKRPVKIVTKGSSDARIWYLNNSDGVQRLNIGVPSYGYYDTNVTLAIGNTDIANALGINAAKVAKGQTIAGVAGAYTSDANAASSTILNGYTAYVNGNKITGNMKNWSGTPQHIDAIRIANNRFEVAVAAGYHGYSWAGNSYEYMDYSQVASAIGLTANKLVSGTTILGVSGSIPSKGAATYTPGTSNQTIASGNYLSGTQTIKGDANLVAGNIAKGKSIFGVTGTYTGGSNPYAIFQSEVKSFSSYTVIPIISSSGFTVNSDNSLTCTTAKTYKIYLASGFGMNNSHEIRYVKNSQATTILKGTGYSPEPVTVSVSLSVGDKLYMDVKSGGSVRMVAILI